MKLKIRGKPGQPLQLLSDKDEPVENVVALDFKWRRGDSNVHCVVELDAVPVSVDVEVAKPAAVVAPAVAPAVEPAPKVKK